MKKKTTALLLSVVLLLCATAGGTVAFMTDKDSAQNVFTVGDIKAQLDEAKTDDSGKALTGDQADRGNENSYPVIPGYSVDKDPTVHVLKGSQPCYAFVSIDDEMNLALSGSAVYAVEDTWKQVGTTEDGAAVYQYTAVVNPSDADKDLVVFNGLAYDETVVTEETISGLNDMQINVSAFLIQANGITEAQALSAALDYFGATALPPAGR